MKDKNLEDTMNNLSTEVYVSISFETIKLDSKNTICPTTVQEGGIPASRCITRVIPQSADLSGAIIKTDPRQDDGCDIFP